MNLLLSPCRGLQNTKAPAGRNACSKNQEQNKTLEAKTILSSFPFIVSCQITNHRNVLFLFFEFTNLLVLHSKFFNSHRMVKF